MQGAPGDGNGVGVATWCDDTGVCSGVKSCYDVLDILWDIMHGQYILHPVVVYSVEGCSEVNV